MKKKLSDHFDGRRFFNPAIPQRSYLDILRWMWNRKVKPWPSVHIIQKKISQERTNKGECFVTFINHSTVLIQIDGMNVLTDPIWSQRASPFPWMGPKRVSLPGVKLQDLPPIDLILISHNHYDHMDIATLRYLSKKDHSLILVPKGNLSYLKSKKIKKNIHELDWWETFNLQNHHIVCVPAQHFSSRGFFDRNRTLWCGFAIKGINQLIYFAGDTGMGPHFAEIHNRLGPPTLSLLPIGAFEPRWIMHSVHLSPEEAVKAHLILGSKRSMGIHFGTFQLTDEDFNAPILELKKSLANHNLSQEVFWILQNGETKKLEIAIDDN